MPALFAGLLNNVIFKPVLRPILRLISGLVAIPLFRFLLKRIFKVKANDAEMERDLEMWFRGAVLLLAATKNFEDFVYVSQLLQAEGMRTGRPAARAPSPRIASPSPKGCRTSSPSPRRRASRCP